MRPLPRRLSAMRNRSLAACITNTRLEQRSRALDLSARRPDRNTQLEYCGGQFELLDSTTLVRASMVAEQESQQDEAAAGSYVKRLVEQ